MDPARQARAFFPSSASTPGSISNAEGSRRRLKGGGEGEQKPNKFFHKKSDYVSCSKSLKESDESTNQHDRNDPHKIIKSAKKEWDQTNTRLAKYDQNSKRTSGSNCQTNIVHWDRNLFVMRSLKT
jgi:hypothetical protein